MGPAGGELVGMTDTLAGGCLVSTRVWCMVQVGVGSRPGA